MLIAVFVEETLKRAEATDCQQFHITSIAVAALLLVVTAVDQGSLVIPVFDHQVNKASPMGLNVSTVTADRTSRPGRLSPVAWIS